MAAEFSILCALPYSVSQAADKHVSLFVSPTIQPEGDSELGQWRVFPDWAATVRAARIELFDDQGPIECEPILDPVDPEVWRAMFPPETPVRGAGIPHWEEPGRKWRSFDARLVHDTARAVHLATMYADPTSPPMPRQHPLTDRVLQIVGLSPEELRNYDESRVTADLDRLVESSESLAIIDDAIASERDWLRRLALELHRCRRYYERPESQDAYRERPDPDAAMPVVPRREPEFHERCAMAGDHPALQRRLGLVVDLRVLDPDRLRSSSWLSARILLDEDASACRSTRVRCRVVGDDLVSVAEESDWLDAALRLGDEELFAVLELDADGSALKHERFLWTLPRLLAIEQNADPVNAATPALRSVGFTVARTKQARNIQRRLDRQHLMDGLLAGGEQPLLSTEDVARGVRVEVWDDTTKRWASLHRRHVDATVEGLGVVLDDVEEDGFAQGTAAHETPGVDNPPVHVHDALFGWEGWSLSAPRPGKRIRHEGRDQEIVEEIADPPADELTHPVRITTRVADGTLPRLRYGRAYAFRAWAVDLAGNSRPHVLNPDPVAPSDQIVAALGSQLPFRVSSDATSRLPSGLRAATMSVLESERLDRGARRAVRSTDSMTGEDEADLVVLDRFRARRRDSDSDVGSTLVGSTRAALVRAAIATAVGDPSQPFVTDTALRGSAELADLVARHTSIAQVHGGSLAAAAIEALSTVTALRPFLRWEPVPSPALVPRHRYTEGESLRVLVVRSGVTQDPVTLAITVTDPAAYATMVEVDHADLDLGYLSSSQRHLAPATTSQVQTEQHGMFDTAIGSTSPAEQQTMLGWALRENGTFQDLDRADIDNPPGRLPQPGMTLIHGSRYSEPKSLPLAVGEAPAPGEYVVHDVDDLALPYLPDPMAHGLSVVFPDAGADRAIPFPFGAEGFTAPFLGDWPEIKPFRMVLTGGPELSGDVTGRVLQFALPAGDVQRLRLASSLTRDSLELFGPWRSMPQAVRDDPNVAEAAADGWLWGLTPFEEVRLVHAVPRPLEAPRPTLLLPGRLQGETRVVLRGAVDVHGPSTDNMVAEAQWTDPVDDLTLPRWEDRPASAIAFQTSIRQYEDLAVLAEDDSEFAVLGVGPVAGHKAVHEFGDTRHRLVDYRFRASTRFREYFHPALLAGSPSTATDPTTPVDDGRSVVGPSVRVSVPSSARPAAPVVHSVLPLFRWFDSTEPEQPMAKRHTRRAGVRIYLERPWFTSGTGELLGVLLATGGDDTVGAPVEDQSGFPFVSKWGGDPIWLSRSVPRRALSLVQLDDLLHTSGFDDRGQPGRPVGKPARLPLSTSPGSPMVTVVGYQPQYNLERRLWYVDVAVDPLACFWPFVRLAVCRYQPDSVDGCHLSAPVRCDFVQLPPERTTSVSRTDDRHVRVVVTGPVGLRDQPPPGALGAATLGPLVDRNRYVAARLQRRDPIIDTDLGWETVSAARLMVRGTGDELGEVAWVGELDAGTAIPLVRPGGDPSDWRVSVEEWEMLPGDPGPPIELPFLDISIPIWERRLVYADEVAL